MVPQDYNRNCDIQRYRRSPHPRWTLTQRHREGAMTTVALNKTHTSHVKVATASLIGTAIERYDAGG